MKKNIITISREYGSGGRAIGEAVAKELGFSYYDRKLIDEVAKETGLDAEYIKSSSDIIKQTFGKMAEDNIFRIGGDEFCVILKDKCEEEYQKAIDEMVKGMEAYNKTADGLQISIAYGYAVYDSNLDASLKETRSRADSMMYEKKFLMKQGQQEDRVSKEQR